MKTDAHLGMQFGTQGERTIMAAIDTIKDILQENMDINPDNVTEEATLESLGLDSLDTVELICELEDRLDIDFGEPEGLATVGDMLSYIDTL